MNPTSSSSFDIAACLNAAFDAALGKTAKQATLANRINLDDMLAELNQLKVGSAGCKPSYKVISPISSVPGTADLDLEMAIKNSITDYNTQMKNQAILAPLDRLNIAMAILLSTMDQY